MLSNTDSRLPFVNKYLTVCTRLIIYGVTCMTRVDETGNHKTQQNIELHLGGKEGSKVDHENSQILLESRA
jgi:hypothetical protein